MDRPAPDDPPHIRCTRCDLVHPIYVDRKAWRCECGKLIVLDLSDDELKELGAATRN